MEAFSRPLFCKEDQEVTLEVLSPLENLRKGGCPVFLIHPIHCPNYFVHNSKSVTSLPLVICHIVNVTWKQLRLKLNGAKGNNMQWVLISTKWEVICGIVTGINHPTKWCGIVCGSQRTVFCSQAQSNPRKQSVFLEICLDIFPYS